MCRDLQELWSRPSSKQNKAQRKKQAALQHANVLFYDVTDATKVPSPPSAARICDCLPADTFDRCLLLCHC